MCKKLLFMLIGSFLSVCTYGQTFQYYPEDETQRINSSSLVNTSGLYNDTMQQTLDNEFTTLVTTSTPPYQFKSIQDYIRVGINHDTAASIAAYKYAISLTILEFTPTYMSGAVPYSHVDITLNFSYDPDSLRSYTDLSVYKFSGFHKIQVVVNTINNIAGTTPVTVSSDTVARNFYIESEVVTEQFDNSYNLVVNPCYVVNQSLYVNWENTSLFAAMCSYIPFSTLVELKPVYYEVEWTYIDDYPNPINNPSAAYLFDAGGTINYDFRKNSTRVLTNDQSYAIPLLYEHGAIIYRVRSVRPVSNTDYKDLVYSSWSLGDYGSISSSASCFGVHGYIISNAHANDSLNWQYTINFAEEGKYKHVINYFDGTLKNRQTQTKINSDPTYIIAVDKVYDYEGRPALQSLPTPVVQNNLQLRKDILINASTDSSYKAADFDRLGCSAPDSIAPLHATAQANIYYSALNPNKTGMLRYIPDAKGYPLLQTIFSPDNTNKVLWQGGAGFDQQLWKGHATHYDYVTAMQPELDRMFGTEAGYYDFYPKQITTDQNGQSNFTIFDHHGKVVATGLQGDSPDSSVSPIDLLPNFVAGQQTCADLLSNIHQDRIGNSVSMETSFYSDKAGASQLQYSVSIPAFNTGCSGKYLWPKAHYNFSVNTDCGIAVMNSDNDLGNDTTITANTALYTSLSPITVNLAKAKYSITKSLSFYKHEIDSQAASFILLQSTTPSSCYHNVNYYIYNSINATTFPCKDTTPMSICGQREAQMKQDLYPGQKYGNYTQTYNGYFGYCMDSNSIFTLIDSAGFIDPCIYNPNNFTATSPTGGIEYYSISTGSSAPYQTGFGTDYQVIGNPNPPITGGSAGPCFSNDKMRYQQSCITFRNDTVNGYVYTDAKFKAMSVDSFIMLFDDQRAQDLLPLHPEFCKLALCDDGTFENTLNGLLTYQQAVAANLFYLNNIVSKDPLYLNSDPSIQANVQQKLTDIDAKRIDSFAIQQAYCNAGNGDEGYQCVKYLYKTEIDSFKFIDANVEQSYFNILKSFYISNRAIVMQHMLDSLGRSCAPCSTMRMILSGTPVFPTIFAANGNIDTSVHIPSWESSAFNAANSGDTAALNTAPAGLTDSIATGTSAFNSGIVDAVITNMTNCVVDTSSLSGLRTALTTKVNSGITITPGVVDTALIAAGFTPNDLCHSFLAPYSLYNSSQSNSANYACGTADLYSGLQAFMNRSQVRSAITGATTAGSSVNSITFPSGNTNTYENKIQALLGATITVQGIQPTVSGTSVNYTKLIVSNGTTTINLYINNNWSSPLPTHSMPVTATWQLVPHYYDGPSVSGTGYPYTVPGYKINGSYVNNTDTGHYNTNGYNAAISTGTWPITPTVGYNLDFPFSPVSGYDLNLTSMTFTLKWSGNTPAVAVGDTGYPYQSARMAVSMDGGAFTYIGTPFSANLTSSIYYTTTQSINVTCSSGHTMVLRLYLYTDSTTKRATPSRNAYEKNVGFSGTVYPAYANVDSFNNAMCINNYPPASLDGYIAKGTAVINAYTNTAGPGTYYVWCRDMDLMTPASGESIANSITCADISQALTAFKNDKSTYGYDVAYNHPLFQQTITNYLNYRFNEQYSYDQYYNLMNGCAVTDQVALKNYTGTFELEFANDALTNSFLTVLGAYGSGRAVNNFRYQLPSGHIAVLLDLNSLPTDSLLVYKNLISSSVGTYSIAANYLYNSPDSNIIYNLNPLSSIIFSSFSDSSNTTVPVYENGSYVTYYAYKFSQNSGTTVQNRSQNLINVDTALTSRYPGSYKFYNSQYLRSSDYYTPIKQQYLNYVYGLTGNHNAIVNAVSPATLQSTLSYFANKNVTYDDPLCTVRKTDLYVFNAYQHSYPGYGLLTTIMSDVPTGAYIFPANNNSTGTTRVYKKANGTYWYQYFDTYNNLFNVYITPPATVSVPISQLLLDSMVIGGGTDSIYSFTAYTHAIGISVPILCQGYTSFALGYSQKLANVILQDQPGNSFCTDTLDCEHNMLNTAIVNGNIAYQQYFDSLTNIFADSMTNFWVQNAVDTMQLCYQDQKYQYTLYYYDRAGNLERTVPPAGVQLLSASSASIQTDRASGAVNSSTTARSIDTKATVYRYDAANKLVYQKTPDGGVSTFYYDAAERMIFSQNSAESAAGLYSYILYDEQNRPIETGEGKFPSTFVQGAIGQNTDSWSNTNYYPTCTCTFANVVRSYSRNDVVATVYDTMKVNLGAIITEALDTQQNLRKRVAAISYYSTLNGIAYAAQASYHPKPIFTTHYSYDMEGNVQTVVYDFTPLGDVYQEYKRVDYDYDLLSGKVNMISYNRNHKDQFYQRYLYDADNRITNVTTSNDGVIWNTDARYSYYPHGPLAQVQIGDNLLQSIEYAYTIQGWLKAMNSDVLRPDKDMGQNGQSGDLTYARDAIAHALHYFQNDYKAIDSTATVTNLPEPTKSLYNGNIVRQNTAITGLPDMQRNYRYDQLQRLKLVSNDRVDETALAVTPSQIYKSSYAYDPDGNIDTLRRNGGDTTGVLFDNLTYAYASGGINNRLQSVQNAATSSSTLPTVQATDNYQYDSLGNLVLDKGGHIKVQWTPYQKVRQILDTVSGQAINYTYDGAGNRVFKEIVNKTSSTNEDHKGEYYVHDATGNILATYNTHSTYSPMHYTLTIDSSIVGGSGLFVFSQFLGNSLAPISSFSSGFIAKAVTAAPSWTASQTSAHTTSFYTTADPGLYSGLLTTSNNYINDLRSYTPSGSGLVPGQIYAQAMYNGFSSMGAGIIKPILIVPTPDSARPEAVAFLTHFCAQMPPSSVGNVCSAMGVIVSADSVTNALAIDSALIAGGAVGTLVGQMVTEINNNIADTVALGTGAMHLLMSTVNDDAIFTTPHLRSATATPSLYEAFLGGVVERYANATTMNAFIDQSTPAATWLAANASPTRQLTLVYNSDPVTTINSYLTNVGESDIDTVIASMPDMTTEAYTALYVTYASTHSTASPVGEFIGEATDTISLAEHHIYGSSRLGIQRYDTVGYRNAYNFVTNAAPIHDLFDWTPWYSYQTQDLVSQVSRDPYGNSDQIYFTVSRVVGRRYYEMVDNLGNVLATVLDRKTGHLVSGATSYDYWKPDLATATDYYPYGMMMPGRSLLAGDTSKYRFAYNGIQKTDEVAGAGNWYSAIYGEYSPRIGVRANRDYKASPSVSPYAVFGGNPILNSDALLDSPVVVFVPKEDPAYKNINNAASKQKEDGIHVYAHGTPNNIEIRQNGTSSWEHKPKELANAIDENLTKEEAADWKDGKTAIVLHSCRAGRVTKNGTMGVAQQFSKAYPKARIIAPDERDFFSEDGELGPHKIAGGDINSDPTIFKQGLPVKDMSKETGTWHIFQNGDEIGHFDGDWKPKNAPTLWDYLWH